MVAEPASDLTARGSARRIWWSWFLTLAVLCLVWGFATPVFAPPDEAAQVIRAAAIGRGQLTGPDVFQALGFVTQVRVPGTFGQMADSASCFVAQPAVTPACLPPPHADSTVRPTLTGFGRYPPLYFALVAFPTRTFPFSTAVRVMRLLSALICAAFLASGFVSAHSLGRWAVFGVAAATTPLTLYLGGVVNASGLELASAICLWASVAAIARGPQVHTRLIVRATIAAVVFTNARGLSLPMAAVAVVAPLLLANRERAREIVRNGAARAGACSAIAAAITALAWAVLRGRVPTNPFGSWHFTVVDGITRSWRLFEQGISWFGYLEVRDVASILIWAALWGFLVLLGLRKGTLRDGLVLVGVLLVAFIVPIVVSLLHPPPIYTGWQGRHGLPLWVGVPILAGAIAATTRRGSHTPSVATTILFAGAVGYGQLSSFATTAHRYAVGSSGRFLYFLDPVWTEPLPPVLSLAAATIGIGVLAWRLTSTPSGVVSVSH